jgi:hypothetical protein
MSAQKPKPSTKAKARKCAGACSTDLPFRLAVVCALESLEEQVRQLSPDANSICLLACRCAIRDARRFVSNTTGQLPAAQKENR